MLSMFLIVRRTLRDVPLTIVVFAGLVVLVTSLVAAPLYINVIEDVGLRATLADAPLDQSGVRAVVTTPQLQQSEHVRLHDRVTAVAQEASWLQPSILTAIASDGLLLPGGAAQGRVALVESEAVLTHLRVLAGRLPQDREDDAIEVVLGTTAASLFGLQLGDQVALLDSSRRESGITLVVVGLVEPVDPTATFWQSKLVELQPVVSASRRTGSLVVAPGTLWTRVVPALGDARAAGEYRWRIVFDLANVDARAIVAAMADGPRASMKRSGKRPWRSSAIRSTAFARSVRLSASLGTPTINTPASERVLVFLDVTL